MSEEINGKIFSIMDPKGVNTVIYRINKTAKEYAESTKQQRSMLIDIQSILLKGCHHQKIWKVM